MYNTSRITECPHCNTAFRVTDAQLRAAKGAVRCGSCLEVFLAHQHWLSEDDSTAELELDDWGDDANAMFAELEQLDRDLENSIDDESWALKLLEEETVETTTAPTAAKTSPAALHSTSDEPLFVVIDDESDATDTDDSNARNLGGLQQTDATEIYLNEASSAHADESILFSTAPLTTSFSNPDDDWLNTESNQREPTLSGDNLYAPPSDRLNDSLDDLQKLTENTVRFETDLDRLDALELQGRYTNSRQTQKNGRVFFPDWLAALLILASAAGLGAQYVLHNLNTLSQNPQWHSTTETFCVIAGCTVPEWRDLQSIQHDNLVVRSHPQQTDALLINVRLINNSVFAQTFPLLELRFSDINGNEIASRRFKPEEYLAGELSGLKKMPVNQAIQIELTLVDPGKAAVNYQLQLLENL